MDLSVFIRPQNGAAVAAAAEPENGVAAAAAAETITISSDDFIPRRVVVENLIKHHQDKIEEFDNAIDRMIDQRLICRDRRDKHKELLK